jgi:hypothetical protein
MKEKLVEQERARARAVAAREARLASARAARAQLFDDLDAFAAVIDTVASARQGESLILRHGDRFLHLEPMGEAERVRVTFSGSEGEDHRLYREPELADRWVWAFTRKRRGEERLPFFDEGLEELLVLALHLPRVTPTDEETAPASTGTQPVTSDPFASFSSPAPDAPSPTPAPESPRKRKL